MKIFDRIYSIVLTLCKLFLVIQILIVSYVVFGRYVLNNTPAWGERTALFALVWFAFLSSTLAYRDDRHMKMTILDFLVPKSFLKVTDKIVDITVLVFFVLMLYGGIQFTELTSRNILTGLGIKTSWQVVIVPIMSIIGLGFFIEKIFKAQKERSDNK